LNGQNPELICLCVVVCMVMLSVSWTQQGVSGESAKLQENVLWVKLHQYYQNISICS